MKAESQLCGCVWKCKLVGLEKSWCLGLNFWVVLGGVKDQFLHPSQVLMSIRCSAVFLFCFVRFFLNCSQPRLSSVSVCKVIQPQTQAPCYCTKTDGSNDFNMHGPRNKLVLCFLSSYWNMLLISSSWSPFKNSTLSFFIANLCPGILGQACPVY